MNISQIIYKLYKKLIPRNFQRKLLDFRRKNENGIRNILSIPESDLKIIGAAIHYPVIGQFYYSDSCFNYEPVETFFL